MTDSLLPFFKPQGVAIVGASTSPEKLGYGVARNLIQSGYAGVVKSVLRLFDELVKCDKEGVLKDVREVREVIEGK
jgi:acyl-CoA synthetase (NDP forming)